ncbi:MAG: PQQ-dependent sugar dehydrogenase, partial [Verrucomicrobia bacterium]|nr:PQQ-dependent sugar dehydrogenase [Verrucomicrobiota bacterium]
RVQPPLVPTNPNDERGFLGLAFHPGFNNPLSPGFQTLYTYNSEQIPAATTPTYIAPNAATNNYKNVVNEWKISATDTNIVDPASRREIISFGKNAGNHNGGTITFGPDGYLYLALGDGGNANDVGPSHIEPGGNAQNLSTPLGKMLRFDPLNPALTTGSPDPVSANGQYRIPMTNPFQGAGQAPEIYAYGLRNPYRFAFDRVTGDLIEGDVGQNNIEEINRIMLGGNYGWAIKEGDFLFNRTNGPSGPAGTVGAPPGNRSPGVPAGLIDPISGPKGTLEYDHNEGISITGGFVYRGTAIPELVGKYIFGDLALKTAPVRADGRLFYADLQAGTINAFPLAQFGGTAILPYGLTVHGFGQDADGEIYALVTNTSANGTGGIVYKLVAISAAVNVPPTVAINSPTNGASLPAPANIPITATAQDADGSVTNVGFFDGGTFLGGTNNKPYTLVASLAVGGHALTAVATDNLGLSSTSAVVNVTVSGPNTPPSVTITNPADNSVFGNTDTVLIGASASDTDGSVTNVQFFDGVVSLGNRAASPYSVSTRLTLGSHTLTAVASDNLGATTTSAPIHVTVARYLPAITNGNIALLLQPMATNMSAPDYAISPPGDTSRLFV